MLKFIRLTVVLAAVAAVAAGALALTYDATKEEIKVKEGEAKTKALGSIFFKYEGKYAAVPVKYKDKSGKDAEYFKVFLDEAASKTEGTIPEYYAIEGSAVGYNSGVPMQILAGFTNPKAKNVVEQAGKDGFIVVGWSVIKSEETPGLGEKIKDKKSHATWVQGGLFVDPPAGFDSRTDFQRQFEGCSVGDLKLKKIGGKLDAITAATITSNGVIDSIRNAAHNLEVALSMNNSTVAEKKAP